MKISREKLEKLTQQYFEKLGSPADQASLMVRELVGANLRGVDSHGVLRLIEYTKDVENGLISPGAPITVISATPCTAVVDFAFNFGQVGAMKATEIASEKAEKYGMATVVSKRGYHIGRLGAYTENLAEKGLVSLCLASESGKSAAPWGSCEGRLGTNPISFGAPNEGEPIVMDFATTAFSQGKIFVAIDKGEQIPEGVLMDKYGRSTTNPDDFYDGGIMVPLGGLLCGHKGFALSVMCEAFGTLLAGEQRIGKEKTKWCNTLCIIAINPDFFFGKEEYKKKMQEFVAYIKESKRTDPNREILMPGEYEAKTYQKRSKEEVFLPDKTWDNLVVLFERKGISIY